MYPLVGALVIAVVAWWRLRHWPLTRCRACKGQGTYRKGKRARRCKTCGGSGLRLRWLLRR